MTLLLRITYSFDNVNYKYLIIIFKRFFTLHLAVGLLYHRWLPRSKPGLFRIHFSWNQEQGMHLNMSVLL